MGLDRVALTLIAPHLRNASVLCLGYPDIVVQADEVEELLGVRPRYFVDNGAAHKLPFKLAETVDTLQLAGAGVVRCVDVVRHRGIEELIDLNHSLYWGRAYDLVIDGGTIEHCMNAGQAIDNAWRAVAVGGRILHISPMTMINHGFYNFCPTLWADFYAANGGKILAMRSATTGKRLNPVAIDSVKRFAAEPNAVLYALVEKVASVDLVWPMQTRYRA